MYISSSKKTLLSIWAIFCVACIWRINSYHKCMVVYEEQDCIHICV